MGIWTIVEQKGRIVKQNIVGISFHENQCEVNLLISNLVMTIIVINSLVLNWLLSYSTMVQKQPLLYPTGPERQLEVSLG